MVNDILKIVWSSRAKKSLKEIYNYIKKDSPSSAKKVREDVIKLVKSLKISPAKFQVDSVIDKKEYHSIPVWSYKVIYRILGNEIRVIDVFHTSRNPDELKKIVK